MINMTKQEAFDKVLTHLRKQGKQAKDDKGDCMYRAPDGSMCAAGCLIPDDVYKADMEGELVDALGLFEPELEGLVADMQEIHDDYWDEFEYEMCALAKDHGLEYTK